MKKTLQAAIAAVAAVLALSLPACKTTKAAESAIEKQAEKSGAKISAQAERTAENYRVLDWQNRSIGEKASPAWLLPAVRGNWGLFKAEWPTQDKVLKIGVARHATLNGAQTVADVQYAARLASELKQSVLTRAGISLDSQGEFDVVSNAATQAHVSIAGQERLTDFWQKVETAGADGKKTQVYNYYVVYAADPKVWEQVVAKYLTDITGQIPEKKTQQTIAKMFDEINAEIKSGKEQSDAQFRAELEARQAALKAPPPTTVNVYAAYRSQDPAQIAAASTSAADEDYVAALRNLAAMRE